MVILGHFETFLDPVARINFEALYTGGPELSILINHSKNLHTKYEIQLSFSAPQERRGPMQPLTLWQPHTASGHFVGFSKELTSLCWDFKATYLHIVMFPVMVNTLPSCRVFLLVVSLCVVILICCGFGYLCCLFHFLTGQNTIVSNRK